MAKVRGCGRGCLVVDNMSICVCGSSCSEDECDVWRYWYGDARLRNWSMRW